MECLGTPRSHPNLPVHLLGMKTQLQPVSDSICW